ncbi:hypothetical protein ACQKP8_27435, partial [Photobacterium alginatilyticum]|uniref:hypothetical protein n=1 Tax=Photobacterium alginatilyticum TaxID=1775171 RepID=UPI0040696449
AKRKHIGSADSPKGASMRAVNPYLSATFRKASLIAGFFASAAWQRKDRVKNPRQGSAERSESTSALPIARRARACEQ